MKKLLLSLLLSTFLHAAYIENAIVACQTLESIKKIEPYINEDSNRFLLPKDCLILTHNAQISIEGIVEEKYLQITVDDLNLKVYTIKSLLNAI